MYDKLGSFAAIDARNTASEDKTGAITVAHRDELQSYLDLIKTANPETGAWDFVTVQSVD